MREWEGNGVHMVPYNSLLYFCLIPNIPGIFYGPIQCKADQDNCGR